MTGGPVFVAGIERTGTSLMYALLASHPDISMTRRTNFWRYFCDQYGDLADDRNLDACLGAMRVYKRMRPIDVDFDALREQFITGPRTYGRLYELLEKQVARQRGKPRWGDKSLEIERYAERLLTEYPAATILHMIRDPRDRLASVLVRWKSRRLGLGAGTASWIWSARLALDNTERYPGRYRVVSYESLVTDPERELRRICHDIGAPFQRAMLSMNGASEFRDQGANSSYGARPSGEISADSIRKYEKVLTARQVAFIDVAAAPEMERLGYAASAPRLSRAEQLSVRFLDRPGQEAVMAGWRVRERWRNARGRALPAYRMLEEAT